MQQNTTTVPLIAGKDTKSASSNSEWQLQMTKELNAKKPYNKKEKPKSLIALQNWRCLIKWPINPKPDMESLYYRESISPTCYLKYKIATAG